MNIKSIALSLLLVACHKTPTVNNVVKPQVTVPAPTVSETEATIVQVTNLKIDASQLIVFDTEVSPQSVDMAIGAISLMNDSGKEVYLILNSPGGDMFSGMRLISYIEGSKVKVNTVDWDLCASMCAELFSHGNKRLMLDHTTLMYHLTAGGVKGTMQNMKSLLTYIDLSMRKLDAYVAHRAGIDFDTFEAQVAKDLWIDAEDAVKQHLADGLVTINATGNTENIIVISQKFKKLDLKESGKYTNPLLGIQ